MPPAAASEIVMGMAVNSSSNMLLRPYGRSGTIATIYCHADYSLGRAGFMFDTSGGMVEHYRGLQFQSHSLETTYLLKSGNNLAWNVGLDGTMSRFGRVTILEGYDQARLTSNVKSYFTDNLLFRWKGSVSRRSYHAYGRESHFEASTIYRLDRFFASGLTLRGQFDAGWRRNYRQTKRPETYVTGFSGRAAKSLRPGWGVMFETFTRAVHASASQDSSRVFNRVFLDDIYKYSSTGAMAGTTVMIRRMHSIQLRLYYSKRTYSDAQTSYFRHLPPKGWDEHETSAYLTMTFSPPFLPPWMRPVLEVYHTDVDASEDKFSYSCSGATIRCDLYRSRP